MKEGEIALEKLMLSGLRGVFYWNRTRTRLRLSNGHLLDLGYRSWPKTKFVAAGLGFKVIDETATAARHRRDGYGSQATR